MRDVSIFFPHKERFNCAKDESYLHSYGEIVFLYALVVQRMVDFNVSPSRRRLGALLKVKRMKLVGLRRGTGH